MTDTKKKRTGKRLSVDEDRPDVDCLNDDGVGGSVFRPEMSPAKYKAALLKWCAKARKDAGL